VRQACLAKSKCLAWKRRGEGQWCWDDGASPNGSRVGFPRGGRDLKNSDDSCSGGQRGLRTRCRTFFRSLDGLTVERLLDNLVVDDLLMSG
jgi:hypothetical protein